jgi:predicted Zn-dependent protease
VRSPAILLALLMLGIATATPAAEPFESARPGQRPPPGSVEDELWYASERAEKDLLQSPLLVRDEALNAYVRGVVCKVAGDHCGDLRVYVVEIPAANATTFPNGMVIVWTGLLLRARDESELASVLAHEFAHYERRHSIQQYLKAKRTTAFLATFGLLTYGGGVGLAGTLAGIAGSASLMQNSREAEREADALGFAHLRAHGYDPQGGVRLWDRMLREEKAPNNFRRPVVAFATHPRTEERVADLRSAAADAVAAGYAGTERNRDAYRDATHAHLPAWLEGELSRRMFATSIQVIADLRPLAYADEQATFAFYQGEAHRRRGKEGDLAEAERLYAEAIALPSPPAGAWREYGLALRARGDRHGAIAPLRRYLELETNAQDAAFVRQYLAELETTP